MPGSPRLAAPCRTCKYDLRGLDPRGVCPECGSRVLDSVRACPRCAGAPALARADSHGLPMWICESCRGFGYEKGELRRAIERERSAGLGRGAPSSPAAATHKRLDCARCDSPMLATSIGAVTIDRCAACGFIWLDPDELPAVVRYVGEQIGRIRMPENIEQIMADPAKLRNRAAAGDFGDDNLVWWIGWVVAEVIVSLLS